MICVKCGFEIANRSICPMCGAINKHASDDPGSGTQVYEDNNQFVANQFNPYKTVQRNPLYGVDSNASDLNFEIKPMITFDDDNQEFVPKTNNKPDLTADMMSDIDSVSSYFVEDDLVPAQDLNFGQQSSVNEEPAMTSPSMDTMPEIDSEEKKSVNVANPVNEGFVSADRSNLSNDDNFLKNGKRADKDAGVRRNPFHHGRNETRYIDKSGFNANVKKIAIVGSVLVAALVIFILYPIVLNLAMPSFYGSRAMVNANNEVKTVAVEYYTQNANSINAHQAYKGILNIDSINIDGKDSLNDAGINIVEYEIEINAENSIISGNFKLGHDQILQDSSAACELNFYMSDAAIYIDSPGVLNETIVIPIEAQDQIGGSGNEDVKNFKKLISAISGLSDTGSVEAEKVMTSLITDVFNGLNVMFKTSYYSWKGKATLKEDNSKISTDKYYVEITKTSLIAGMVAIIDNMWKDDNLKPYIGMLKIDKERLKKSIESSGFAEDFTGIGMMAYVVGHKKLAGLDLYFRNKKDDSDGSLKLRFFGEKIRDDARFYLDDGDRQVIGRYTTSNYNHTVSVDIGKDEKTKISLEYSSAGSNININKATISGKINDSKVDLEFHGNAKITTYSSMKLKAEDFPSQIHVDNMTAEQRDAIYAEIESNTANGGQLYPKLLKGAMARLGAY